MILRFKVMEKARTAWVNRSCQAQPSIPTILAIAPRNALSFLVEEPSGDSGIPAALVVPQHYILSGDRSRVKPFRVNPRCRVAISGKGPVERAAPVTHSIPYRADDSPDPGTGMARSGGLLVQEGEMVLRIPDPGCYQVETPEGEIMDRGTFTVA